MAAVFSTRPLRATVHALLLSIALTWGTTGCSDGDRSDSVISEDAGIQSWSLDPSKFDCTSLPALPPRVTNTPPSCGTDRTCTTKQVCGHRGVGGELGVIAPENTLAAYRAAIALGLDYVETDPRPTKDDVLVNVHDPTVDRTTDGHGKVIDMTLEQVKNLLVKSDKFAGDFSCEKIPTLREILGTCRGRVHVLVDANKTDRVDLLVADIVETDSIDWAIFDTSSLKKIKEALALEPRLNVMPRVTSVDELHEVLDALKDHPPVIIEVGHGSLAPLIEGVIDSGNRPFVDVFGQDLAVNMDTKHDPSVYASSFDAGAQIVQSDRPELVLQYLGRLNQRP